MKRFIIMLLITLILPIAAWASDQCPDKMSFIPGGEYMAGEDPSFYFAECLKYNPNPKHRRLCDENPEHRVFIDDFCMDKYEVTQAEFEQVMGNNPSNFKGANRPVEQVNWHEAKDYCQKVGKRLPTEWEWEKAAKGGTTTKYYWGNDVGRNNAHCNLCGSRWGGGKTAPVGSFAANPFGLHDMSGNVWEWTDSDEGSNKVLRGGGWFTSPVYMRSGGRGRLDPAERDYASGFRCSQ